MLKIKRELNYRRGGTCRNCEGCDHYVASHMVKTCNGNPLREEPRCKVVGLENGRMYRVHPGNVCDKYDNTLRLAWIKDREVA